MSTATSSRRRRGAAPHFGLELADGRVRLIADLPVAGFGGRHGGDLVLEAHGAASGPGGAPNPRLSWRRVASKSASLSMARARTVIIEDRGLLAFLFLNNNLHVVHHVNPGVPWYRLPALYRAGKERYLEMNDGYVYRSYGEVFRRYLFKAKDPVPHPIWRR